MRRNVALFVTALLLPVAVAHAGGSATRQQNAATLAAKKQSVLVGWYRGKTVKYFDFGRIRLRRGNRTAPVWLVTNGARGQRAIFDVVPGPKRYTALWRVHRVTWKAQKTPRMLKSASAIARARAAGQLVVRPVQKVINAPLLGFGQTRHAGFARNQTIHYYELGLVKVAPGNEVLPIWTFTNGVAGQRNVADVKPGTTAYPPLWAVVEATWRNGADKRLIRSHEALMRAVRAGDVALERTSMIVNCPFV